MDWLLWFSAPDYQLARVVLQRGIAVLFFIAFLSSLNQFPALLGERGLLPVPEFIAAFHRLRRPTLFRWGYSDRRLRWMCGAGLAISGLIVLGVPQLGPPWVPLLAFLALWGLYMSIVNVGQTFYSFGWEMLLLEAGFTVAFLGSDQSPPPTAVLLVTAWLVFRLEFGAGMIKIRGGSEWRNFTALYYHHETQPMPGPLSRQFHLLPKRLHRAEVAGNHFAQLVVPFFLFAPQPLATIAAALIIVTQLWLVLSGNFAWLNWSAIVLAFSGVSDRVVHAALPFTPARYSTAAWADTAAAHDGVWSGGLFAGGLGEATGYPGDVFAWAWAAVVLAASLLLAVLGYWPARNLLSRRQLMNASFNRWQLGNTYGAFGSVTKHRVEIVVEGTLDDDPTEDAAWREYRFKGKPGEPGRVPRQWAPYHLRLDWLMWFLPLRTVHEEWFYAFLFKLLEADPATLRLLRADPFDGVRPRWVRVRNALYEFSTHEEFRATRERWVVTPMRVLIRPVQLKDVA
ncbi:lipase maturation factor family protein [Sinomonas sp. JGH33]|uniref:Lipase maturation factor family protein n=1 Tax=Sinomonas terricola TaxID=3110330 RepID=A0ABU5T8A6_9MICC|nr:lipase maturation factor family protein [Sinomonas sp. JGH33]MEA5455828.1 lipase maturation factor family protein [Sinomonas sp. JGH33]